MKMKARMRTCQSLTLVFVLTLLFTGCASTKQARNVEPSGFLGDYSKLREGGKDEALLVYRNPHADISRFNKIIMEPVQIWPARDSDLNDSPEREVQRLISLLHSELLINLREDWEIVNEPGADVMRIRVAITEADKASVVLNMVSTVFPIGRIISEGKNLASGTHSFVGAASVEAEISNAATGEVLWAGVDRRVGGKTVRGSASKWSDVREAFKFWSRRLTERLRAARSGS